MSIDRPINLQAAWGNVCYNLFQVFVLIHQKSKEKIHKKMFTNEPSNPNK